MREVTALQSALMSQRGTKPRYLVVIDAGGVEHWSSSGDIEIDGVLYRGGGFDVRRIVDWTEATIEIPSTPDRLARLIAGEYRGAPCSLYAVASVRYPQLMAPGYWADDYVLQGDVDGAPLLLLPGVIDGGREEGGRLSLEVVHDAEVSRWSPAIRVAPPWANHLPRPGTVIVIDGEHFVLEAA